MDNIKKCVTLHSVSIYNQTNNRYIKWEKKKLKEYRPLC